MGSDPYKIPDEYNTHSYMFTGVRKLPEDFFTCPDIPVSYLVSIPQTEDFVCVYVPHSSRGFETVESPCRGLRSQDYAL